MNSPGSRIVRSGMMKQTIPLLAATAVVVAGFAASPSHAHGVVTATVGLPPVTVGVGGVVVTVGEPAPPPPPPRRVVVVQPAPVERVVYVEPAYPPPPSVVYVHPREEQVVYVEDDCKHHHPNGKAWGYWKKHGYYR